MEGTNDDMLRNTLTHLYFKYKDEKRIPHYEKENVLHLYASYNGNSYVSTIVEEMKSWEEII
jgi:beta-mannanase